MSYKSERTEAAASGCTCTWTAPNAWVYHRGAVEPGSQIELTHGCPVHDPVHHDWPESHWRTPGQMDYELGMLHGLREKLFLAYQRTGAMIYYTSGAVKGRDDAEEPGLRRAMEIIGREIELRERR